MSTIWELKQERQEASENALAIAADCCREHREFTPAEMLKVEGFKATMRSIDRQLTKDEGDAALTKAILALGAGVPNPGQRSSPSGGARVGGAWGDAFFKSYSPPHGTKQLLTPSGGVGIPSLSSTIPAVGELGRLETLLQAIKMTGTDNSSIEYLREVTRTHAAAPVAAGAQKPESTYELEEIVAPAEVIAHLSKPAPRSWFADAPGLSKYLDTVLRLGLRLEVETQCILGNGASPQLQGMAAVTGAQVQPYDSTPLITARRAITRLENINVPDDMVFCYNPFDWETIELSEDLVNQFQMKTTVVIPPVDRPARRLWGVPVVLSTGMPECTALLFSKSAVELFERQAVELTWSENTYDPQTQVSDFQTNQIRWRCEGRYALCIYRPAAIVVLDVCPGT